MYKHFFKRLCDFGIALVALIVLAIPLAVITLWLHFANRRPQRAQSGAGSNYAEQEGGHGAKRHNKGAGAFFYQERPGKGERIFKVVKFKSMTDERDAEGNLLPDAQRITKVGKFVRKTSIDELPQLFNVLKGDMALIGPRPLLPQYLGYYTQREQLRHTVRPGITGWAQVNGRNNVSWDEKLELDAYYVEHLSLWMDLRVFFTTIKNVLNSKDIEVVVTPNKLDDERRRNGKHLQ